MKKLNRFFLKKINAVLVALLGFFGFSMGFVSCMYGYMITSSEFSIKGQVTNVEDGAPIEGIRIDKGNVASSVFSNEDGNFKKQFRLFDAQYPEVPITFRDVDGVQNGLFRDTTIVVRFEDDSRTAVVNVELTPKAEE